VYEKRLRTCNGFSPDLRNHHRKKLAHCSCLRPLELVILLRLARSLVSPLEITKGPVSMP